MHQYKELLRECLTLGNKRKTRAGQTLSLFGANLAFNLSGGFPAVTIKKLEFQSVAAELAGFLRAEEDASKMGSSIWERDARRWYNDPDSDSRGPTDMGRIYGVQWRQWWDHAEDRPIDQLRNIVDRIKEDPTDRRLVVSAWNVADLSVMCLPPCHTHFQFYVNKNTWLDCIFYMRSVDLFLGLPFDIASYALLTHIVANETGLKPGKLMAFLGDYHIYTNHIQQVNTVLMREPKMLPQLRLNIDVTIDNFTPDMADLSGYIHHPAVRAPLNVGN